MADRTLSERIDEGYAEAWKPKNGDTIMGEVVEISTGETAYGAYPIVTIETAKGKSAVHAFHSVLLNALVTAAPAVGETIAIKYEGTKMAKSAKPGDDPYHAYRVMVDRKPADVWGRFDKHS